MIWTLLAYIAFWVALFCAAWMILIVLSSRSEIPWLRRLGERFGPTAGERRQVQGLLQRLAIIFLAAGVFLLVIAYPKDGMTPEQVGQLTLLAILCGVIVFWQIRGIRNLVRSQRPGDGTKIG